MSEQMKVVLSVGLGLILTILALSLLLVHPNLLSMNNDGLVKSPSSGRTRKCTSGGWGWNQLNFIQMAVEGTPSPVEKKARSGFL